MPIPIASNEQLMADVGPSDAKRLAFLLRLTDALRDVDDAEAAITTATRMLGEHLRVAQVGFGEIDAAQEHVIVHRDWNDGQIPSVVGTWRMDDFGAPFIAEMKTGATIVIPDIETDARTCAPEVVAAYRGIRTRAILDVPLVRSGRFIAMLFIHHPEPRVWTDDEVRTVEAVCARLWDAVRRERLEAQLRASEERFALLVGSVQDYAIYMLDTDGHVQTWNAGAERLKGYRADEIIGQSVEVFFTPEERAAGVSQSLLAAARQNGVTQTTGIRVRKDGSRFAASVSINALHDARGCHIGFAKITHDIDVQLAHEAQILESEARLQAVVDTAVDAIVVIDEAGSVQSFNRAAEQIFGYSAADIIGRNVSILMPAIDASVHDRYVGAFVRTGQAKIIGIGREVEGRRKDGHVFPLDLSIAEWRDRSGTRFFTGIMRDISRRRQIEAELEVAHRDMVRVSRLNAMGAMAGTLAHELNQPLAATVNYLAVARHQVRRGDSAAAEEMIDSGLEELSRVSDIIGRMREFARTGEVRAEPQSLAQLLARSWKEVETSPAAAGLVLRTEIAHDAATVIADRVQIEQVFVNLIRNAAEAMAGHASRTLDVSARRDGDMVEIRITDSGLGLSDERLACLFTPFQTTKTSGTGLGLPICRTIIEAHRGQISAEHHDPCGTTFIVTLPSEPALSVKGV